MDTSKLVLGKSTVYANEYAPSLLQRIERSLGRSQIKNLKEFEGFDLWRIYEFTYLNENGLPQVAMGTMEVPANSKYIVESKSLKLYTMSYTMTRFKSLLDVESLYERDLSELLEAKVKVHLYKLNNNAFDFDQVKGICLEDECRELNIKNFNYEPNLLKTISDKRVKNTYYSNLFRSLCPVTAQPDYAVIKIEYDGLEFNVNDLLAYLVSLRNHQGFHEQCVELIYSDLMTKLKPRALRVSAMFTRRGGIDINPCRYNVDSFENSQPIRTIRQ